ncbi:MAG: cobyrinate a,c-diamide synthase [Nitrospirota bacterium]|nr:cobyrinate a,c-diamide synthase [Nitrospirota bacterium]
MGNRIPTIVIAAPQSGSGKTTVALGLMAALKARGYLVQPFKVGPDFIDAGHHTRICGRPSRNLDSWMMGEEGVREAFNRGVQGADIAVIEGVMGLFDGYDADGDAGSTAHVAKLLGAPVLLVVDGRSMARSAGALVLGFESFDPDLQLAGVIFNRIGSERHGKWLRGAVKGRCRAKVLGCLPRDGAVTIPERHLGLLTAEESGAFDSVLLKEWLERHLDLDEIVRLARSVDVGVDSRAYPEREGEHRGSPLQKQIRIGIPMDEAFCFYYQDNLDLLEELGAELVFFSPLKDSSLPPDIDGLYIGGGYPEVHAERLSANTPLREEIRRRSREGMPIYAECGGLIYLSRGIYGKDGSFHDMAGIFPFAVRMRERRVGLGYVTVQFEEDGLLGASGQEVRAHEFHYSEIVEEEKAGVSTVWSFIKRPGEEPRPEGFVAGNTLATYAHIHFGADGNVAEHLLKQIIRQKETVWRHS